MTGADRCWCFCHHNHDDTSYKYGVSVAEHVACILACDQCRRNHAAVLDDPPSRPLPEPIAPYPADATGDGE